MAQNAHELRDYSPEECVASIAVMKDLSQVEVARQFGCISIRDFYSVSQGKRN